MRISSMRHAMQVIIGLPLVTRAVWGMKGESSRYTKIVYYLMLLYSMSRQFGWVPMCGQTYPFTWLRYRWGKIYLVAAVCYSLHLYDEHRMCLILRHQHAHPAEHLTYRCGRSETELCACTCNVLLVLPAAMARPEHVRAKPIVGLLNNWMLTQIWKLKKIHQGDAV